MPVYVYECLNCHERQEITHSIHDDALAYLLCVCSPAPQPGKRLIVSAPAVSLKGYGFYRKDNLPAGEKYSYDHFDDSGTQSEKKAMGRKIKDPTSAIPGSKIN